MAPGWRSETERLLNGDGRSGGVQSGRAMLAARVSPPIDLPIDRKVSRMLAIAAAASPAFWDRSPRPRPSGRTIVVAVTLLALIAVAAVLRLRALSAPYWIDEGISVGISSHPLSAIPGVLREDGSPPLYYMLLHVWMALFGTAPSATHALSAAIAIACVPAAWWAVAPFGTWAGLVAAGLMAL